MIFVASQLSFKNESDFMYLTAWAPVQSLVASESDSFLSKKIVALDGKEGKYANPIPLRAISVSIYIYIYVTSGLLEYSARICFSMYTERL